jgi:ankyrin repeat protein
MKLGGQFMPVLRLSLLSLAALLTVDASAADADDALRDAAEHGDRITAARLLDNGADVSARAADGTTPLHWATRADSLETVKLLLEAGADASAADLYGITPMYLAAENGSAPVIAALLDAGADPNTVAPTGQTALMTAALNGRTDAIALLLDRGAVLDARDPEYEQTALMIAVREGNSDAVALLIERGADVNAFTRIGDTPAFIPPCKRTGCFSEGAGINRGGIPDRGWRPPARGGLTPLLYASRDGLVTQVEQLLAAGADVELAEANGIRPLLMALINGHLPVVDVLLKHNPDVNADDFWGRTPLFTAVEFRNRDLRNRDLIAAPVDRTAFLEIIELLIERGANVNARTREWPHNRSGFTSDLSWVDMTGQDRHALAACARRGPQHRDVRRHYGAHGCRRGQLDRCANLHGVSAGLARCDPDLSRPRCRCQRRELDGRHGDDRCRQPRVQRHHSVPAFQGRAARRRRRARPLAVAMGRGRVPRHHGRRG